MRFLVLTYSYPPLNNPRAIRWGAIAQYWAAQGHQVDVVCGWGPGQARNEHCSGVAVHRVGGNVTERLRARLRPGHDSRAHAAPHHAAANAVSRPHPLKRLARVAHDLTWKKLYWPDSNCLWQSPAVAAAAELLDRRRYDAVISVSIPFTSHLAAYRLRETMGDASWLVDIGDPFSFLRQCPPNNTALYRRKNFVWERRIFDAATAVAVTSDETAARYRELHPHCADKLHVIGPLATQPQLTVPPRQADAAIKLVYTGTLYRNIRNPRFLLDLFGDLLERSGPRRIELHLYGLLHDCADIVAAARERFGDALQVHGTVPPQEAQRAVAGADVLVNIGNATPDQLPSKVVDYAATGKPILNLVSIPHDSSAAVLQTHPSTLTIQRCDPLARRAAAERAWRFIGSPPAVDPAALEAWMSPYTIEHIAGAYQRLADDAEIYNDFAMPARRAA